MDKKRTVKLDGLELTGDDERVSGYFHPSTGAQLSEGFRLGHVYLMTTAAHLYICADETHRLNACSGRTRTYFMPRTGDDRGDLMVALAGIGLRRSDVTNHNYWKPRPVADSEATA